MADVGRPFASFLAAVLVLLPLPLHWRARNIPTLTIIAWLFVENMTHGINVIEWTNSIDLKLLTWCDITIRLDIGANIALPAACFCLCMHLESIASIRRITVTASDKRRRMLIDLAICWLLPMVYIGLFYIVQGHRFDIVEDFGCRPETYVSIPEFLLMWLLPILFCLGTFILAGIAFFHFFRRRATFAGHLASSNSALTPARYMRLMAMSVVEMIWDVLIISFTLAFNYRAGLRPWTGWDNVHSNFSNINRFPIAFIDASSLRWTYFLWWTTPMSAYLFFIFFAFGKDAVNEYTACGKWIARTVFRIKLREQAAVLIGSSGPKGLMSHRNFPKFPEYLVDTLHLKSDSPSPTFSTTSMQTPLSNNSPDRLSFSESAQDHYYDPEKAQHTLSSVDDSPFELTPSQPSIAEISFPTAAALAKDPDGTLSLSLPSYRHPA